MANGNLGIHRHMPDIAGHCAREGHIPGSALMLALFPESPASAGTPGEDPGATTRRRIGFVAAHVVVLATGAMVMLARIPGRPAWTTIYNEDLNAFLPDALARPWHLFTPYAGYVMPATRLVAQLAALLPLRYAALVFALTGALVAAACAVVVFHASAGHIRSVTLRVLAGASVLLLPVATLEIADSTVDAVWYLLLAFFWVVLWRPQTRGGMVAAASVAFFAAAAQPLTVLFVPLLAARVALLRRLREHAVTAGWAAGLLVQVVSVFGASALDQSRSRATQPAPVGQALAFYAHGVIQFAFGWHVGWWLQSVAGRDGAAIIVGVALAVLFGWVLLVSPFRWRLLIAVLLLTGFAYTIVSSDVGYNVALIGVPSMAVENGSRYTTLPLFLIDCAAIIATDMVVQRRAVRHEYMDGFTVNQRRWPRQFAPVLALVAVLSVGWVTDFRFDTARAQAVPWSPRLAQWEHGCARESAKTVLVRVKHEAAPTEALPCTRIRG